MQTLPRHINPFALMLNPEAVIAQIERSERLEGLHRRVCRPLDKPLLGGTADAGENGADEATDFAAPADEAPASCLSTPEDAFVSAGNALTHGLSSHD